MPYFTETSEATMALEKMVDDTDLSTVIYALSNICRAKAEHLRANWQDAQSAKVWDRDAAVLDKLPSKLNN